MENYEIPLNPLVFTTIQHGLPKYWGEPYTNPCSSMLKAYTKNPEILYFNVLAFIYTMDFILKQCSVWKKKNKKKYRINSQNQGKNNNNKQTCKNKYINSDNNSFEVTRNMSIYTSCGSSPQDFICSKITWKLFLLTSLAYARFQQELLCFYSLF